MAEAKLDYGVERVLKNGTKLYHDWFVKTLLEDIASGRTTPAKAMKDFKIKRAVLYKWIRKGAPKPIGAPVGSHHKVKRAAPPSTSPSRTPLDELANQYGEGYDPSERWSVDASHLPLAIRYCRGEVSRDQVNFALRKAGIVPSNRQRVMTTRWLGAVMVWALRNGYELRPEAK